VGQKTLWLKLKGKGRLLLHLAKEEARRAVNLRPYLIQTTGGYPLIL